MINKLRFRLTLGAAMLIVAASALVVRAFVPMSAKDAIWASVDYVRSKYPDERSRVIGEGAIAEDRGVYWSVYLRRFGLFFVMKDGGAVKRQPDCVHLPPRA